MRYAIVNTETGIVENLIEYETQPSTPPAGFENNYIAVANDTASTGWEYNNGVFTDPNPPVLGTPIIIEQEPTLSELQTQLSQIAEQIAAMQAAK